MKTPKLTKKESALLDAIFEQLDEWRTDLSGGYPSIWSEKIPGYIVRADVTSEDEPQLEIYKVADVKLRLARAVELMKETEDGKPLLDKVDAWYEGETL